jgi:DNA-directed RNA polymerase
VVDVFFGPFQGSPTSAISFVSDALAAVIVQNARSASVLCPDPVRSTDEAHSIAPVSNTTSTGLIFADVRPRYINWPSERHFPSSS